MVQWLFVAVRGALIGSSIVGAFIAIRRSGRKRSEVNAATRRFLIYWGCVLTVAIAGPALIYNHFQLWHWLFG